MLTNTQVSKKPEISWPDPITVEVKNIGRTDDKATFIAHTVNHGKWKSLKARHVGSYHAARKLLYVAVLAVVAIAGAAAIWWFVSNFGPDYKESSHIEYIDEPPSSYEYLRCEWDGISTEMCDTYYGGERATEVADWTPYWGFWSYVKQVARGIVGLIGLRFLWISAQPLGGLLKSLYADLRTRFARIKGGVRRFDSYKTRMRIFEKSLARQVKEFVSNAETGSKQASVEADQVVALFIDSLHRRDRRFISEVCDMAMSTYLIGTEDLVKMRHSAVLVFRDNDIDKQIQKVADGQAATIVQALVNEVCEIDYEVDQAIADTVHLT